MNIKDTIQMRIKRIIFLIKNFKLYFSVYKYNHPSISVLPFLNIQYSKWQGVTSFGCIKLNINYGWLIFGGNISTKHEYKTNP